MLFNQVTINCNQDIIPRYIQERFSRELCTVHCFGNIGVLCILESNMNVDIPVEEEDMNRYPKQKHELKYEGVRDEENEDEEVNNYHGSDIEECFHFYAKLVKRGHKLMIERNLGN